MVPQCFLQNHLLLKLHLNQIDRLKVIIRRLQCHRQIGYYPQLSIRVDRNHLKKHRRQEFAHQSLEGFPQSQMHHLQTLTESAIDRRQGNRTYLSLIILIIVYK